MYQLFVVSNFSREMTNNIKFLKNDKQIFTSIHAKNTMKLIITKTWITFKKYLY